MNGNRQAEAASPPPITAATSVAVVASGAPRTIRDRPSGLKGRYAIASRRPPAAFDPGASAAPRASRRARLEPAPNSARRTNPVDETGLIHKIKVSTV